MTSPHEPPIFSVIIPAANRAPQVASCLQGIRNRDDGQVPFEIIIADGGSGEETPGLAAQFGAQWVRAWELGPRTIAALRNDGARAARGRILAFLDADMEVSQDWLSKAQAHLDGPGVAAVGFRMTVPPDAGWVGRLWGMRSRTRSGGITRPVDFLPSGNVFVRRDVFTKLGGFDSTLAVAEDKDFSYRAVRAGYSLRLAGDAEMVHLGYERTLGEFIRKEWWRQEGSLMLARKHGFAFRLVRQPLLSLWHAIVPLLAAVLAGAGLHLTALAALVVWVLPSCALAVRQSRALRAVDLPGLALLTWLRWTTSGVALSVQIFKHAPARADGARA